MSGPIKHVRGWPLYVRVLRQTAEGATARELSTALRIDRNSIRKIVLRLHQGGVLHIASWGESSRGQYVPIWKTGQGLNAPMPICKTTGAPSLKTTTPAPYRPRCESTAFCLFMRALMDEAHSVSSLMDLSGAGYDTVTRVLRLARGLQIAYIADWQSRLHGGSPMPLWRFGFQRPNASRPQTVPRSVVEKRYRDARRAKRAQMAIATALASNSPTFNLAA